MPTLDTTHLDPAPINGKDVCFDFIEENMSPHYDTLSYGQRFAVWSERGRIVTVSVESAAGGMLDVWSPDPESSREIADYITEIINEDHRLYAQHEPRPSGGQLINIYYNSDQTNGKI